MACNNGNAMPIGFEAFSPRRRYWTLVLGKREFLLIAVGSNLSVLKGNSLVLHCAFLLRTIFASLASAHEHVRVQNVRDFPQTKPDSEITAPFRSNEHGDPRFFFSSIC